MRSSSRGSSISISTSVSCHFHLLMPFSFLSFFPFISFSFYSHQFLFGVCSGGHDGYISGCLGTGRKTNQKRPQTGRADCKLWDLKID